MINISSKNILFSKNINPNDCSEKIGNIKACSSPNINKNKDREVQHFEQNKIHTIEAVKFNGFNNTSSEWAREYLQIDILPLQLKTHEIDFLAQKLLTTSVFTKVEWKIEDQGTDLGHTLVFDCHEKWTTIPVVRGQYGGGTPLLVIGGYEFHSFGKLWIIGAEYRKYGQAKPGGVLYAKAPRWRHGKHSIGLELWDINRLKYFMNFAGEEIATLRTTEQKFRAYFLAPYEFQKFWNVEQIGFDLVMSHREPSSFAEHKDDLRFQKLWDKVTLNHEPMTEIIFTPTLLSDSIQINNINYDGLRTIYKLGIGIIEGKGKPFFELESFYYKLYPNDLNLAIHGFFGYKKDHSVGALYYLSGLDSLRGLTDGAVFGTLSSYINIELRNIFMKKKNFWLQ